MNISQIEESVAILCSSLNKTTFIFELLLAYGQPKASIKRLQVGNLNLSKKSDELLWKNKVFYKETDSDNLFSLVDEYSKDRRIDSAKPRFIIVSNFTKLAALDTRTRDTLDVEMQDIRENFDFFLPWAGMEKSLYQGDHPADVKAAERMAKLFDQIKKDNPTEENISTHALNIFLTRLLFCFFAEDTEIYKNKSFTNLIKSHTQEDGSDFHDYLQRLFHVLNTPVEERHDLPQYLMDFPYVNGGLFEDHSIVPKFSRKSRQAALTAGDLNWAQINPDIFGSMIQAVVRESNEDSNTEHYTSVPNIMKVIEPLFLDELYEELESSKGNKKKLNDLRFRISKIKIFDPACGSGNFLIIAYKELRRLEMKVIKELGIFALSDIQLSNFYGIEIEDLACEVAKLSLWLAEHQMNIEFREMFGRTSPTLPLKEAGEIVCGNACRLDWELLCPKVTGREIYLLGNPPYVGARKQTSAQKSDIRHVFNGVTHIKKIDYISCWFYKASKYIEDHEAMYAFVSTNSISQGEQVSSLWPFILADKLEIFFAYKSFKWGNNAKHNAGVTVVIIGIRNKSSKIKYIFFRDTKSSVENINPYLINMKDIYVKKKSSPISQLPIMEYGNMAIDEGNLILQEEDKEYLLRNHPDSSQFIRVIYGANEFLKGLKRYCLWIESKDLDKALAIPEIKRRILLTKQFRLNAEDKGTNKLAARAHQFREMKKATEYSLLIPTVTSERREYIPIGMLGKEMVVIAPNQVIYDPPIHVFAIISSRMHMAWVRAVAGRLKTDYRYSSTLCYNTFPFPEISENKKKELAEYVYKILEERERFSEKSMSQLYDPNKMPTSLREAHKQNDVAIERCYRSKPFESDEERLEYLFKMYVDLTNKIN